jgi:hypothetical protein
VTEGDRIDIELLLSQPEILAWLELSEQEVATLLRLHGKDDEGEAPRAA